MGWKAGKERSDCTNAVAGCNISPSIYGTAGSIVVA
jgi:hypothetical protein